MKNILRFFIYAMSVLSLLSCSLCSTTHVNQGNIINNETASAVAYAALAAASVYEDDQFEAQIEELGWQKFDENGKSICSKQPSYKDITGLAVDIWENKAENKIMFVFRGTEITDIRDILEDSFLGKIYSPQYKSASSVFKKWRNNPDNKNKQLILTGHSLGGSLALDLSNEYKIDAIVFDSMPTKYLGGMCNIDKANRVSIYEDGEFLEKARELFELCELVSQKNTYLTQFMPDKCFIGKHDSYQLALGLLRQGAEINPKLEKILEVVSPQEKIKTLNWMNQTALASLVATRNKEGREETKKITANFSDSLSCIKGNDPSISQKDWNTLFDKIKEEALKGTIKKEALKGVSGLDDNQQKEAWQLLITGRAESDIRKSIKSTFLKTLEINPTLLQKTVSDLPDDTIGMIGALTKDFSALDKINGWIKGNNKPSLFGNTLQAVESEPLGVVVSDSVKIFINKDNRTMRLAIIAYARMNGINVTEDNLNDLNDALSDNPDLSPLLAGVFDTMKKEYGVNDAKNGMQQAKEKIEDIKQHEETCR